MQPGGRRTLSENAGRSGIVLGLNLLRYALLRGALMSGAYGFPTLLVLELRISPVPVCRIFSPVFSSSLSLWLACAEKRLRAGARECLLAAKFELSEKASDEDTDGVGVAISGLLSVSDKANLGLVGKSSCNVGVRIQQSGK
ncbi:hypothetical protein NDU88_002769 [Pleurodeles waltl]|uniref:Uncharacterized protein n=1 Tax=Pleurodeles waltl TaxID=8319 RepID=A0AAV7PCM3_PLEWA|nr:hypothetical protein NDU88_002769 [Pleurodeles waltl]